MKPRTFLAIASLALAGCLSACGGAEVISSSTAESSSSSEDTLLSSAPISSAEEKKEVSVFVLTGQSNMEGNSYFDDGHAWLKNAFTNLGIDDGDACFDGIPEVQTSFFGAGYGEISDPAQVHASNTEDKMAGKFLPTQVGMGHTDKMIGPELGAAYVLRQHTDADHSIYFIKCASGGSGFAQSGTKLNWDVSKEGNIYETFFKPFVENNLALIEQTTGVKPTLKGFLWHQGCSDCEPTKIAAYQERMDALLATFKGDFEAYAPDQDRSKIAFIDAYIYDGPNKPSQLSKVDDLNAVKTAISEESDRNFIVNSSHKIEGGLALNIVTNGWGDVEGGNGTLHYKTKDMFQLGMAYGQIIADHLL